MAILGGGYTAGEVRAKQAIVLAGESYLTRLPGLRRVVLPVYSLIVLTEPLRERLWAQIGWQNRESVSSSNYTVDYLTRTADGTAFYSAIGERLTALVRKSAMIRIGMQRRIPYQESRARVVSNLKWSPRDSWRRDTCKTHSLALARRGSEVNLSRLMRRLPSISAATEISES